MSDHRRSLRLRVARTVTPLLLGLTLLTGPVATAVADDAPPVAHDISLLKALGLPEVNLVVTDADVTGAPAELKAGRYLVSAENKTAKTELEVYIAKPPAGLTSALAATAPAPRPARPARAPPIAATAPATRTPAPAASSPSTSSAPATPNAPATTASRSTPPSKPASRTAPAVSAARTSTASPGSAAGRPAPDE